MINKVIRKASHARSVTQADFEKYGFKGDSNSTSYYLLIHRKHLDSLGSGLLNVPDDCYCIFWQGRNNTTGLYIMGSAVTATSDPSRFPMHYGILVSYEEIKNIHKNSKYVLPEDIECILEEIASYKSYRAFDLDDIEELL